MKNLLSLVPRCLPLCWLVMHLGPATARADSYQWTGPASGDFDSANWLDNDTLKSMSGPPGGGDSASIPDNTILSGSGSVEVLESSSSQGGGIDGTFSCTTVGSILLTGGTLTANTIGNTSGADSGLISVMGGQLTAGSVDSAFDPDFSVSGGGSVVIKSTVQEGEGGITGAGSLLEMDGALMNFNGGPTAGGTLTAQSIQSNSGLSGMIYCDGAGSLVSTTGTVEFDGQGTQVTNGGHFTIGGNLNLEPDPTDVTAGGSAYLDGAGTAITVAGAVYMGPGSTTGTAANYLGEITISDGASLQATALTADSPQLGRGTVELDTGSTLRLGNALIIGGNFTGGLQINGGSSVVLTGGAGAFGLSKGSSAMVTVSGSGSSLNVSNASFAIGQAQGSTGSLELDTSAAMQLTGSADSSFFVGDAGTGNLAITSDSTVQILGSATTLQVAHQAGSSGSVGVQSTNGLTLSGPAIIGNQGTGSLYIDGTGGSASASANGNFYVGGDGTGNASTGKGTVGVLGGGQFTVGARSTSIGVGNGQGAEGEIYVQDAGSALQLTGVVIAGVHGTGELAASGGASVQSVVVQLGAAAGSIGNLLVYNTGTTWTNTASIILGGLAGGKTGGEGDIAVNDNALLRIYHQLSISNKSLVDVAIVPANSNVFPFPASPITATPKGRIFVGKDNFGPDGTIRVGNGGILTGKGRQAGTKVLHTNVIGNVVIGLGGKFQPGGDPDAFSIKGDCDLSDGGKAGGETDITVAGTGTAGTDYDQFVATGKVTLGGTLKLVLMEGYKPQAGDTIEPIKAKTTTGNFAEVVTPGLTLHPEFNAGKLSVKVMSVADVPAPVITSDKTATAHIGEAFSYQVIATGLPAGYAAAGLPSGLDIDPSTGLISGTPSAAGTASVTLSSTSVGGTGKETLKLTVAGPVSASPAITVSEASIAAVPGAAFSYQIVASNAPTSYAATGLPPGLSVNTASGVVSGQPAVDGTYTVTLSATNATGTGTAKLKLVVALPAVKVTATVPEIAVGSGKVGEFTLSLPVPLETPLMIHFKITGSAEAGKDYVSLKDTVVIKTGQTTKVIKVVPRGDLDGAMSKVVKLTLTNASGYKLQAPEHAKVKIVAGQ